MSDTYDHDPETGEIHEPPRLPVAVPTMRPLASLDTTEVCTALAVAQGAFEAPKRTKTATITPREGRGYSYAYAPLEEVVRVIQKPMADNGLSRQQYLVSKGGNWFVRTIIWHVSGQWISSDYPIFAEAMTQQKFQSGVTYAKRQGLSLALGLAPEDDDDANVADSNVAQVGNGKDAAPPPRQTPPGRREAEQPNAAKIEADKRYREIRDAIDNAANQIDAAGWADSPAWDKCFDHIVKAEIEKGNDEDTAKKIAANVMQGLRDRIARKGGSDGY
jgi:hypothetical protein